VTLVASGNNPVACYIEATCAGPDANCRALVVDITSVEHAVLAARARGIAQERDATEWANADDDSRKLQAELRRLAAKQLEAQEADRRRIAADLHDGLGQSLSLLKLWIQEALRQMDAGVPPKTVESVKKLLPKVAGALDELRRAATELRPSILDHLGILATLSWFFREFESANLKTRIEKDIRAGEEDVPQPLKIVIFRILQEAVNNAVKHAGADRIRISLYKDSDTLTFSIEDDGKGIDPGALSSRGDELRGIGMQSMKERAELSGGTYTLISGVGKGTKICVSWPAVGAAGAR
jgi:signal transduction histidine kinase